jgi:hypothetical protein
MKSFVTVIALFLGLSSSASACTIFIPGPDKQFRQSDLVVLAYPVATSFRPKEAASPNRLSGTFRQTILWEVLLSWKGALRTGDRFTTRRQFSDQEDCTSFVPVRGTQPHLVFSKGAQPYSDFQWYDLKHAREEFKYLSTLSTK